MRTTGVEKFYSIAGRVLAVSTPDDWSSRALAKLIEGWFFLTLESDLVTQPDASITIKAGVELPQLPHQLTQFKISDGGTCFTDQVTSYLRFDRSLVKLSPSRDVTVWIDRPSDIDSKTLSPLLSQALSAALRRCGLFEFHSGAVVPPGQSEALLIAGASGSGKSTLTAHLAAAGWSYLSDDTMLLSEIDGLVDAQALRRFFALTEKTVATLPSPPPFRFRATKERFFPAEIFSGPQIEMSRPVAILFPVITSESETRMKRLSTSETMSRLLKLCPWSCYDIASARDHVTVLGTLTRQARGFAIFAGNDLLRNPVLTVDFARQACLRELDASSEL